MQELIYYRRGLLPLGEKKMIAARVTRSHIILKFPARPYEWGIVI
jgi:hypothetical protein